LLNATAHVTWINSEAALSLIPELTVVVTRTTL
jgi:hypothetical protein